MTCGTHHTAVLRKGSAPTAPDAVGAAIEATIAVLIEAQKGMDFLSLFVWHEMERTDADDALLSEMLQPDARLAQAVSRLV